MQIADSRRFVYKIVMIDMNSSHCVTACSQYDEVDQEVNAGDRVSCRPTSDVRWCPSGDRATGREPTKRERHVGYLVAHSKWLHGILGC
jgi:hypothetical protein